MLGQLNTGSPIGSFDCDPTGRFIAVGGREILKLLEYQSDSFRVLKNLRTRAYTKQNTSFIAWNPIDKNCFATATLAGSFHIWDISSTIKQFGDFKEHSQAVNKVSWNPQNEKQIISASHDGSIKLWDVNQNKSIETIQKHDSVRDVKYHDQKQYFACAYESGIVEIYDRRNTSHQLYVKKNAHNKTILTLDWNPSKSNLLVIFSYQATGSMDKEIKIWNIDQGEMEETLKIQNLAGVSLIKWRPGYPTQLGIASFNFDNTVSIWDLDNKFRPALVMKGHTDVVTSFHFNTQKDQIITGSKDSYIISQDISNAAKPFENCNKSGIMFDKDDNVVFFSEFNQPVKADRELKIINCTIVYLVKDWNQSDNHFEGALKYYADNYKIKGETLEQIVDHNILVAHSNQKVAKIWKQLYILIDHTRQDKINDNLSLQESQYSDIIDLQALYNYFQKNPGQLQIELDQQRIFVVDGTINIKKSQIDSYKNLIYQNKKQSIDGPEKKIPYLNQTIIDTIQNLIDDGELQHGFFIYFTFQEQFEISEKQALYIKIFRQWTSAYLELLRYHGLYTQCNYIIKNCKLAEIRDVNKNSALYFSNCLKCRKEIFLEQKYQCYKCKNLIKCTICQKTLAGMMIWCQICGHSFHPQCALVYFSKNEYCPTGCGHKCFYVNKVK